MSNFKEKFNSSDIKNLKFIGRGGYGKVYTDGKYIIKIYNERLEFGTLNPSISMPFIKQWILMKNGGLIKRTNLPFSLLCDRFNIVGVKTLYTPGETLLTLKNDKRLSSLDRYIISRDLVFSSEELTNHRIYCLDYKLENAVYDPDNKRASFIDLDDDLSKYCLLKNIIYEKIVLHKLRDVILSVNVDEFIRTAARKVNLSRLEDYPLELELYSKKKITYDDLKTYVKKKEHS